MQGIHHHNNIPIRFPDIIETNHSPINVLTNIMATGADDDVAVTPFRSDDFKNIG